MRLLQFVRCYNHHLDVGQQQWSLSLTISVIQFETMMQRSSLNHNTKFVLLITWRKLNVTVIFFTFILRLYAVVHPLNDEWSAADLFYYTTHAFCSCFAIFSPRQFATVYLSAVIHPSSIPLMSARRPVAEKWLLVKISSLPLQLQLFIFPLHGEAVLLLRFMLCCGRGVLPALYGM